MSLFSRIALAAALSVAVLPAAQANSLTDLGNKASSMISGQSSGTEASTTASGQGSVTSLLSSLGSGNFNFDSAQNVAGVLGYCQSQGYSKSATETVKDKLMSKLGLDTTDAASESEDYQQGLTGLLQGEDGETFSLSSIKGKLGKKACSMVTDQAASRLLGS